MHHKGSAVVILFIVIAVALLGGAAWFYYRSASQAPVPTSASAPDATASSGVFGKVYTYGCGAAPAGGTPTGCGDPGPAAAVGMQNTVSVSTLGAGIQAGSSFMSGSISGSQLLGSYQTDAQGNYRIPLQAGIYAVCADAWCKAVSVRSGAFIEADIAIQAS